MLFRDLPFSVALVDSDWFLAGAVDAIDEKNLLHCMSEAKVMNNGFHRLGDIRRRMSNGVPSGYQGKHGFLLLRRMESLGEGEESVIEPRPLFAGTFTDLIFPSLVFSTMNARILMIDSFVRCC